MWATGLVAGDKKRQGVFLDGEAALFRNFFLAGLDFRVIELFHAATVKADQMIMVRSMIDFKNGFATLKIVALKKSCLFKLGQYAIDGGQTDIRTLIDQDAVYVFGGKMPDSGALEEFENFQARCRCFKSSFLQTSGVAHDWISIFVAEWEGRIRL